MLLSRNPLVHQSARAQRSETSDVAVPARQRMVAARSLTVLRSAQISPRTHATGRLDEVGPVNLGHAKDQNQGVPDQRTKIRSARRPFFPMVCGALDSSRDRDGTMAEPPMSWSASPTRGAHRVQAAGPLQPLPGQARHHRCGRPRACLEMTAAMCLATAAANTPRAGGRSGSCLPRLRRAQPRGL
jgi:hypothetical protein